jgi:2-C-methyl-D-erythritol 4-phosphate cytidylyltransferase
MPDCPSTQDPCCTPARLHAVLPCAGSGARAGLARPKQYQPLAGQALVLHTLAALRRVQRLASLSVVVSPGDTFWTEPGGVQVLFCGGETRAHSVFNGLCALLERGVPADDWVLVHDAARCLVNPTEVDALIDACLSDPQAAGGLLALPLPDTLKAATTGTPSARVLATVERGDKWLAQTPQMARLGTLHAALAAQAVTRFAGVTDEASALELAGHAPLLVRGSARNFKVTYPEDFALAEAILKSHT